MDFIQSLSNIGVVEILKGLAPIATIDDALESQAPLAGDLPGHLAPLGDRLEDKPSTQPSLFWRALAHTFLPWLSTAGNLADENQALFVTSPDQAGIPGGSQVPKEVTNYQLFAKADAAQRLNHPQFSLEAPSYFDLLALYLRSVTHQADAPQIAKARADLIQAGNLKNQAWEQARSRYTATRLKDKTAATPSFIDFLNADDGYIKAWQHELDCERAYTKLQAPPMEDVARQLDIIKSADDRLVEKVGNNMPCSAMSEDYIRHEGHIKVDPSTIYYRPFYSIANWEMICNSWLASHVMAEFDGPHTINCKDMANMTWSELGHEDLDKAAPLPISETDQKIFTQLDASITFQGKPVVVDVDRGLWDVKALRIGKPLVKNAPAEVTKKFFKTTKLLLAWGFEIQIKLPQSIGTTVAKEDINLGSLRLPVAKVSDDGKVLKFSAGGTTYPVLVAVLATMV